MNSCHNKELKQILNDIENSLNGNSNQRIFILSGLFGTGKSVISKSITNNLNYDFNIPVFRINDFQKIHTITDFTYNLSELSSISNDSQFEETSYNFQITNKLLANLQENNINLFNKIKSNLILKRNYLNNNSDLTELKNELDKVIEKKGHQRILTQTDIVVAESFLVDLLNYFVFSNQNYDESIIPNILISVDNYDIYNYSINKWLFEIFFPYCFSKKLSEFCAYNISDFKPESKVSDFININFLLTTRKPISDSYHINITDEINTLISNYVVHKLELNEIIEFLKNTNTDYSDIENIIEITSSIPYLIDLWAECINVGLGADDVSIVYQKAASKICEPYTEFEKDCIYISAFFDDFDEDALRCFPHIISKYELGFEFIKQSNELFDFDTQTNRYSLKPIFKKYILNNIEIASLTTFNEFKKIANEYKKISQFFVSFSIEERDFLRQFAYLDFFDENYTFNIIFENDAEEAKKVFNKYKNIFNQNQSNNFSFKPEYKDKFDIYNHIIDNNNYNKIKDSYKKIWNMYKNQISNDLSKKEEEIKNFSSEIKKFEEIINENKNVYEQLRNNLIENENSQNSFSNQLSKLNPKNYFSISIGYFICIIIFSSGIFWGNAIFPNESIDNISTIETISLIISTIFIALFVFNFTKYLKIKSKETELISIKSEMNILNNSKQDIQNEMLSIQEKIEDAEKSLRVINLTIENNKNDIQKLKQKINLK